jgi:hypothetical protein
MGCVNMLQTWARWKYMLNTCLEYFKGEDNFEDLGVEWRTVSK